MAFCQLFSSSLAPEASGSQARDFDELSLNILHIIDHLSTKKQTGELQLMVGMRGSKWTSTLETISIIWIGIRMTSGCLVLPQLPAPPTTAPISSGSFDVLWGLAHFSLFYFLFCTLCTKSQISGQVDMNFLATIFKLVPYNK